MSGKKIKIIIVFRDISGATYNMFFTTIIIDEADLEKILPSLIREDIAKIEIQEYNGPLMDNPIDKSLRELLEKEKQND